MKLRDEAGRPVAHSSHSARSAWIETRTEAGRPVAFTVALRKECVD